MQHATAYDERSVSSATAEIVQQSIGYRTS
jgi:hypothetical protein